MLISTRVNNPPIITTKVCKTGTTKETTSKITTTSKLTSNIGILRLISRLLTDKM
ncbi:hypothetical protein HanRHA438_Chr01g0037721 [Helianthus annuus]|nr:hypothetical protein HanRHA438_Chr01g0037721 [Helianthus annuus]